MNRSGKGFTTLILAVLFVASLGGCQKEGPAEHAGKELDKAVDSVGQHIEKTGEKIQDSAKGDGK